MSLRFVDGFDHYDTPDLGKKWDYVYAAVGISGVLARPGSNGRGVQFSNSGNPKLVKYLDAQDTWVVGWAQRFTGGATSVTLLQLRTSTGSEQCSLRTDAAGRLVFTRNGTVLETSEFILGPGWYFFEVKATIGNTTGAFEVRVDGLTVLGPTTGVDTQTHASETTAQQVAFWPTNAWMMGLDDVYICDGQGSVNNDFLGPVTVCTMWAEAEGSSTQWTPQGHADNFVNVMDDYHDGDLTFVQDSTAGHIDLYGMTGIPAGTIVGVQTNKFARKDAGPARTIRDRWKIDGTGYSGATRTLTGSYADYTDVYETSPDTGVTWTDDELNALEYGVELVS